MEQHLADTFQDVNIFKRPFHKFERVVVTTESKYFEGVGVGVAHPSPSPDSSFTTFGQNVNFVSNELLEARLEIFARSHEALENIFISLGN